MHIDSYQFGAIVIDGTVYRRDLVLLPGGTIRPDWWRAQGHSLAPHDLGDVITAAPAVFIMGCGAYGALTVPDATQRFLADHGIELLAQPTAEAVAEYNRRTATSDAGVAGGFHLTC